MYLMLTDVDAINDYAKAGLLWWVGKEDGGNSRVIGTTPYIYRWKMDDVYIGYVGIQVEE